MPKNRNIPLLYGIRLCESLIFAYVIERLFWLSRGMSISMVVACEMIYAAVVLTLEVPSGVFADRLGRKRMMVLAAICSLIEMTILLLAGRFWHFAASVAIAGVGKAASSGAENALLFDTLAQHGRQDRFAGALGRLRAVDGIGVIIAALCGSFLAERGGLILPYQLSLASLTLAFCATLGLREPPRSHSGEARVSMRAILRAAASFFRRQPAVLPVITQAAAIAAIFTYIDEFWQLYLEGIGFPVLFFGIVMGLLSLARIIGSLAAGRMKAGQAVRRRMLRLSLSVALLLLCAGALRSLWGVIAMLLAACAVELTQITAWDFLHRRIDGSTRATIESIGSLMERAAALALGILFAAVADGLSLYAAYTALALCCAAGALGFYLLDVRLAKKGQGTGRLRRKPPHATMAENDKE